jgi:hypothetical protein
MLLGLTGFITLATLNAGGYRYGASDQAFYVPAVQLQLDPELFPRDHAVLAAQTHLTVVDELIAATVRLTGASLPAIFLVMYVAALALLAAGVWLIGLRIYRSQWTAVALLAAMTLRHAIARSGTNTLEGYFHPRTMAFAFGALAMAAFLRGRLPLAFVLIGIAGAVHPTTALWFGVWFTVAAWIVQPRLRLPIAGLAGLGAVAALWALSAGPLAGRLALMDPAWRATLVTKDYLFPLEWPPYAWLLNLGYLPAIAWIYTRRARAGVVGEPERGLVLGSASLLVVFATALVLHAIGVTIAIQLQPARAFWMFDFLFTIYVVWLVAEGFPALRRAPLYGVSQYGAPFIAALVLLCLSAARGAYVLLESERPVMQISIPDDDWGRVMAFAKTTARDSHWLAHPIHAALYGTSLRIAAERDVFVEGMKDVAIGMYDRDVAMRTAERLAVLRDFDSLNAADARTLAAEYDLDYLVTESPIDLPVAFESGRLRVYQLQ